MKTLFILLTLVFLQPQHLVHAAETPYFEKHLSEAGKSVGKTLDHVKVKTEELAKEAKESKEVNDWSHRVRSAAKEFSDGVSRAWDELRGKK